MDLFYGLKYPANVLPNSNKVVFIKLILFIIERGTKEIRDPIRKKIVTSTIFNASIHPLYNNEINTFYCTINSLRQKSESYEALIENFFRLFLE